MPKRIVYITYGQFGYVVGSLYYAKYLNQLGYKVGIICADAGKPKIEAPKGVDVFYVSLERCKGGFEKRRTFIKYCKSHKKNFDIFIIRYFQLCSTLVLFLKDKYAYIDYRTGMIGRGRCVTFLYNLFNRIEMIFARKVFILSEELAKDLWLPKRKYLWLPLGADDLSSGMPKEYKDNLNLLYIGTLSRRDLEESVIGFAKFYNEYKTHYKSLSYHIVGRGSGTDIKLLNDTIQKNKMQDIVIFHGSMSHKEAQSLFDHCNCGVAYVPETFYYDHQPSTKIFEYNLSGLICIATSTTENLKAINKTNGILCHSNPESSYDALTSLYLHRDYFNWSDIRKSQELYSWTNIVKRVFDTEFKSLY